MAVIRIKQGILRLERTKTMDKEIYERLNSVSREFFDDEEIELDDADLMEETESEDDE